MSKHFNGDTMTCLKLNGSSSRQLANTVA